MAAARPLDAATLLRMALVTLTGLVAIATEAAPVGLGAGAQPSPDLLFCVVAHVALRLPAAMPMLLAFALGLARDLLTDVPVGLGALTLVLAAEALKGRRAAIQRQPLVFEIAWVGLAGGAMSLAQWLGVTLSLAQPAYLGLLLQQYAATLLAYPAVGLFLRWVVRIRDADRDIRRAKGERG